MPQIVKKRRSGWAVLAMGALIASLLAVGPAPAGAAEIKTGEDNKAEQSAKPTFTACVGEALEDAGFTDLGSLDEAVADINCLAYYAITTGRTADTFDPDSNVRRSNMALFLYRAADAAGVDLMGGDGDADFGDIAELGEDRQNAITALARNGIMAGRGDMAFDPHSDITRAEMAVALVGLAKHVAPGEFVQSGALKGTLDVVADEMDYFADARAALPRAADTAVSYAYELGITTGYPSDATFRPNEGVPRRNMATFIMRTLAHSNLRPAGLSVQSAKGTLTVSMRDADFAAVDNEIIDAFYVSDARVDRAFNDDDECRSIVNAVDGSDECEIDTLDPATDADGNAQLAPLTSANIGTGITVWVWSGDIDDEVDEDTDLTEFPQGPVVTPNPAKSTAVSPSQAKTPRARFGAAVEFTAQLKFPNDNEVSTDTAVGAKAADGGAQYKLVKHVFSGTPVATLVRLGTNGDLEWGHPTGADGAFELAGDQAADGPRDGDQAGGLVSRSAAETLKTGASGSATFSLTTTDPDTSAASDNDSRTVVYVLSPDKNAPPNAHAGFAVFSEAGSSVTVVKVTAIMGYAESPSASSATANGVVVSVLDQYHRPMRDQPITLTSSVNVDKTSPPDGDFTDDATANDGEADVYGSVLPGRRHTASTGNVRISYSHRSPDPSLETITAWWSSTTTYAVDDDDFDETITMTEVTVCPDSGASTYRTANDDHDDDDDTAEVSDVTTVRCGKSSIYWVDRTDKGMGTALSIVAGSVDDDEIVVDSDANASDDVVVPWLLRYDGNDILQITRTVDEDPVTDYVDIDGFEEALALIFDPDNEDGNTNNGTLTWDSYKHDDEDDRTLFTLIINPI